MKKIIVLISLVFMVSLGFGQYYGNGSPEYYKPWEEATLVVVEYPKSDKYNEAVKSVVQERWHNDKIEYMGYAEYLTQKKLTMRTGDIVVLKIDGADFNTSVPSIQLFDRINLTKTQLKADVRNCNAYNIVSSTSNVDKKNWCSDPIIKKKCPILKRNMISEGLAFFKNAHIETAKFTVQLLFNTTAQFANGKYQTSSVRPFKVVNGKKVTLFTEKDFNKIKGLTLLINENCIPKKEKGKILASKYKFNAKPVNEDELGEAIKNKDEKTAYLHFYQYGIVSMCSVIDVSTREVLAVLGARGGLSKVLFTASQGID